MANGDLVMEKNGFPVIKFVFTLRIPYKCLDQK